MYLEVQFIWMEEAEKLLHSLQLLSVIKQLCRGGGIGRRGALKQH